MYKRFIAILLIFFLMITMMPMGKTVEAKVNKRSFVKKLNVDKKSLVIYKGKTEKISVSIKTKGKASKKFTVKVNNKKIIKARIKNNKILLTAKKPGKTKVVITSKAKNSKGKKIKKIITVNVKNKKNKANNSNNSNNSNNNASNHTEVQSKGEELASLIVDNSDVEIGTETNVTVTGKILNGDDRAYSVVDSDGKYVTSIHDDGMDGDDIKGDGYYTGIIKAFSSVKAEKNYYVFLDNKKSQKYVSLYFYKKITDEDNQEFNAFKEGIDYINSQYVDGSESSARNLYNAMIEYLDTNKKKGIVKDYTVKGSTITIKMVSEISLYYEFPVYENVKSGGGEVSQKSVNEENSNTDFYTVGKYVASFEPYPDELVFPGFDISARTVSNSKFNYNFSDNLDGEKVSLEKMKYLNDYNIIIWNGHGGFSDEFGSIIFSGTKISDSNNKKYSADICFDRIVNNYSGGQYGVTPAFFDKYYQENDFKDTLIYFGACHSAEDNRLSNVLIKKGVDAILGYKNSVKGDYDEKMVQTVFSELCSDKSVPVTIDEALATAKKIHGKTDGKAGKSWWEWLLGIEHGSPAELHLIGNKNYTLKNNITEKKFDISDCTTYKYKGHKYSIIDYGLTWTQAKRYCEILGGHLVTVTSEDEQDALVKFLKDPISNVNKNNYWLGAKKNSNGDMQWVTNEDFDYTAWANGQPDHLSEQCLMIYRYDNPNTFGNDSYLWNDLSNDGTYGTEKWFGLQNFGFICEWD